jgi:hypothetical protein
LATAAVTGANLGLWATRTPNDLTFCRSADDATPTPYRRGPYAASSAGAKEKLGKGGDLVRRLVLLEFGAGIAADRQLRGMRLILLIPLSHSESRIERIITQLFIFMLRGNNNS